jgi:hypothetical protein
VAADQPTKGSLEDETLSTTHSFILKFWLEETSTETDKVIWRGRITHVPSNAQVYVKNLEEVIVFISSFIHISYRDEIESRSSLIARIRRLLKYWLR